MAEAITESPPVSKEEMLDNLSNKLYQVRIGVELGNTTWRSVWPNIYSLANIHSGLLDLPDNALIPDAVQNRYNRILAVNTNLFEGTKNG